MELWESLEKQVRFVVGGRATPASGAGRIKGDVRTDTLYVECKQRSNKSGVEKTIPGDWLDTAQRNTRVNGLVPLIAYREDRGGIPTRIAWFCCRADLAAFEEVIGRFVRCRADWAEISESSVREFAREEAE